MNKNYKIAIYAICKNEEQFVHQWIKSMWEADAICVLDTGSTDNTYKILQEYAKQYPDKVFIGQKTITPWRFDVARNESMKLIPQGMDIYLCTDLDELLVKGWSNLIKSNWEDGLQKLYYKYAWSHNPDGSPARVFWYDKCTNASAKWHWEFPVHETLYYEGANGEHTYSYKEKYMKENVILLHHYPVNKPSRGNYLTLLEQRCKETPDDFYSHVYLSHEYFYHNYPEKCIDYILKVTLPKAYQLFPNIDILSLGDLYFFIGKSYAALQRTEAAKYFFRMGMNSCPTFRENYLELAELLTNEEKYEESKQIILDMFSKTKRFYSWLEWDKSWKERPWDILSLDYYYTGNIQVAEQCCKSAIAENQTDKRLQNNLKLIQQKLEK